MTAYRINVVVRLLLSRLIGVFKC